MVCYLLNISLFSLSFVKWHMTNPWRTTSTVLQYSWIQNISIHDSIQRKSFMIYSYFVLCSRWSSVGRYLSKYKSCAYTEIPIRSRIRRVSDVCVCVIKIQLSKSNVALIEKFAFIHSKNDHRKLKLRIRLRRRIGASGWIKRKNHGRPGSIEGKWRSFLAPNEVNLRKNVIFWMFSFHIALHFF